MQHDTQSGALSRRRVVQGALWAAPVIVIASAIPAAAASTDPGTMGFAPGAVLTRGLVAPRTYTFSGLILQHLDGLPITNVRVTIVPDINMTLSPTVGNNGWLLVDSPAPTPKHFEFVYGATLSTGPTPPLDVVFTRANNGGGVANFTVSAVGSTAGGTNNVVVPAGTPFGV